MSNRLGIEDAHLLLRNPVRIPILHEPHNAPCDEHVAPGLVWPKRKTLEGSTEVSAVGIETQSKIKPAGEKLLELRDLSETSKHVTHNNPRD